MPDLRQNRLPARYDDLSARNLPLNVLVFWEDGFPFLDTVPLSSEALQSAFTHRDAVRFAGVDELPDGLRSGPDLFVTPYGSAFPKSAWSAFVAYLRGRGNWVNLGGSPVSRPVRRAEDPTSGIAWTVEPAQPAYAKELQIRQAFPVDVPTASTLVCPPPDVALETHFHRFRPQRVWELQPRFTTRKDFQEETGSSGPREGVLRPLVVTEVDGHSMAAPIVAVDWMLGDFAGGRWVLAACKGNVPVPTDLVRRLCEYAARPRAVVTVRPSFACYYPGEMAMLTAQVRPSFEGDLRISLRVFSRDTQREVYAHLFRSHAGVSPAIVQTSPFPAPEPGLYIVRASVEAEGLSKPLAATETGFWVYDRDLIASGEPIRATSGLFERGGNPYPVTGTTYMAGDANRKFLFEPNPAVWDTDMAAMRAAGVNVVRTGLWTGWKRAMLNPGAMDEAVLRAFAAYLLTARRHDLPVVFTFFSFLPELWGGENPYLDPRSIEAQVAFVSAFARRFAGIPCLWWDLINEPSFCSPRHVWRCRPNYDRHEETAWAGWLGAQGRTDNDWRARWGLTPNEPLGLPALGDFEDRYVRQGTHPLRVLDYRRFAQDMFAHWAARLRDAIRENGTPEQLVTVGQDEGGAGERPNPWFHVDSVDFTCNHSWWENDDLLWDSVVARTPGKPCLIEETGVMYGEGPDGSAWWTPEEARSLLERKMVLSFAAGCAGFVQWQWNTNVHMDSDLEAGIGLLRADGTEKPEMDAFRHVARFMAESAHWLVGRRPEDVVVVLPHSLMLSVRDLATAATRRCVRALEHGLGLPCRAVGEYRADLIGGAHLIVLPSARALCEASWQALLSCAANGATLLLTGFVEADEHWRPVGRLGPFGLATRPVPVLREELLEDGEGNATWCTFPGGSMQRVEKAVVAGAGAAATLAVHPYGRGHVLYCPLPVELADGPCVEGVYRRAATVAGISLPHVTGRLLVRKVAYEETTLCLLVNETGHEMDAGEHGALPFALCVPAGRAAMAILDRASGKLLAAYRPAP